MENSAFAYSPLAPGWIRLLRLLPNRDSHAPIQCLLFDFPLHEAGDDLPCLYEAVSYVWGDADEHHSINVNGSSLAVRSNLHAALIRFRDRFLDRILWIDAVCINQDDKSERGHQVQKMADIYRKADRVTVWLGEDMDGGDQALEKMSYLPDERTAAVRMSEMDVQAVFGLLGRAWFRRVWVLQEVYAARHIRIRCGSVEVDGHAFCTGLHQLESGKLFPRPGDAVFHSTQPVVDLMNNSVYRNKDFKDGALPLTALIDMYRNHEATERHDKIFALLGMSSDDSTETKICPDYFVPWESLLRKLAQSVLGHKVEVQIPPAGDVAIIHGGGRVIGVVRFVLRSSSIVRDKRFLRHVVSVTERKESRGLESEESTTTWILRTSAIVPAKGDFIFQLDGAPQPSLIRPCGDHFTIIIAALNPIRDGPLDGSGGNREGKDFNDIKVALARKRIRENHFNIEDSDQETPQFSGAQFDRLATISRQHFVDKRFGGVHSLCLTYLVWDWKAEMEHAECTLSKTSELHTPHGPHSEASEQGGNHHDQATRLWGSLELIADARHDELFRDRLVQMIPYFLRPLELEDGPTMDGVEKLADSFLEPFVYSEQETILWGRLLLRLITARARQRGLRVPNGMEPDSWDSGCRGADNPRKELVRIKRIADALAKGENMPKKEKVLEAEAAAAGDEDGMRLLLELWGEQVQVTKAMYTAIRQGDMGVKKMELLMAQRGRGVNVTKTMVVEAVRSNSLALMTLLFDTLGSQVPVSEAVFRTAARYGSVEMMRFLLDKWGNQLELKTWMIEDVAMASTENTCSVEMMSLLFDRCGNQVEITEGVVMKAAGGQSSDEMLRLLLDRGGSQVRITEWVMIAAILGHDPGRALRTLVERGTGSIPMTKDMLRAASGIDGGVQLIRFLLDSMGDNLKFQVDRKEIEEAETLMTTEGRRIQKLVLERIDGSQGADST